MDDIGKYVVKVKRTHEFYVIARLMVTLASCGIVFLDRYKLISTKSAILLAVILFLPLLVFSAYIDARFRCPVCGGNLKGTGIRRDVFDTLPKYCPHCGTDIDKGKPDYNVKE